MSEENYRSRLLTILRRDAYAEKNVILSSGKSSHYYIDCRQVTLSAEGAFLTGKLILEALTGSQIQAIGGLTLGADPIVAAVAALSFAGHEPIQAFIVRKESKKHGQRRSIEGPALPPGARVAVVDDVAPPRSITKQLSGSGRKPIGRSPGAAGGPWEAKCWYSSYG
jgi:orotate phosphoribosyltransferase